MSHPGGGKDPADHEPDAAPGPVPDGGLEGPRITLHDPETLGAWRAQSMMFQAEALRWREVLAYADEQQGRIDAEVEERERARDAARADGEPCTDIDPFDAAAQWSWVLCCLAQALQTSENTVAADINDARFARDRLPTCWSAFHAGLLGARHLSRVVSAAEKLTDSDHVAGLDEEAADYAASHRMGQLQTWLNKQVARLEPEQFTSRCAENVRRRRVWVQDLDEEGVSQLCAVLPTMTAQQVSQRLQAVAKSSQQPVPRNPEVHEMEHHDHPSAGLKNPGARDAEPSLAGPSAAADIWTGGGCVHGVPGRPAPAHDASDAHDTTDSSGEGADGEDQTPGECSQCAEAEWTAEKQRIHLRELGDDEAADDVFVDYGPADPLSPDFDPSYVPSPGLRPESDSVNNGIPTDPTDTAPSIAELPVSIGDGDARTLAQREADMLAGWLLNSETDADIPIDAHIGVLISAESFTGQTSAPGLTRDRRAPISSAAIRGIARAPAGTTTWHEIHRRRSADPPDGRNAPSTGQSREDPDTSRLDVLSHVYRGRFVPAVLRQAISFRDGVCAAEGCMVPAENCDMDHRTPWPAGRTTGANIQPLCRRHHRMKTVGRPIARGSRE